MPTYVTLINWTDQGVKNYKDTVDRYEAAQKAMGEGGVSFRDVYWTVGPYDIIGILEAPDDDPARLQRQRDEGSDREGDLEKDAFVSAARGQLRLSSTRHRARGDALADSLAGARQAGGRAGFADLR